MRDGSGKRQVGALVAAMLIGWTGVLAATPAAGGGFVCEGEEGESASVFLGGRESVTFRMRNGVLQANGVPCARNPSGLFIQQGSPTVGERLVFDLSEPWQDQDTAQPISVQLNINSGSNEEGLVDQIVIKGAGRREWVYVDIVSTIVIADRPIIPGTPSSRIFYLFVESGGDGQRYTVDLRGGKDVLEMTNLSGEDTQLDFIAKGGAGPDRFTGGVGTQVFLGGPGADVLKGAVGDDRLVGGPGDDVIGGGPGADTASGGAGNDTFDMEDGAIDTVRGDAGTDTCACDDDDTTTSVP